MQIYFFKHPLISGRTPGRYGYDVTGRALTTINEGFRLDESFKGRIYGDGYGDNQPGSNVDPNVLSDTIPWFLSFCRICNRADHNLVRPKMKLLSEVVSGGDLIIFGGAIGQRQLGEDVVFVDTILCVNSKYPTVEIPRKYPPNGKGLNVEEYCKCNSATLMLPRWNEFQDTSDFELNLKDAMPGGNHYSTRVGPGKLHLQIVGTRLPRGAIVEIRTGDLLERFHCGKGFNACPLQALDTDDEFRTTEEFKERPGLFVERVEGISDAITQRNDEGDEIKVTRLQPRLGMNLVRRIIEESDLLVLDPVKAIHPLTPVNSQRCH